jgi:hypothetical protein
MANVSFVEEVMPMPFFPAKSLDLRLRHFDENIYNVDGSSHLFRFVDALVGSGGAGDLKHELLLDRLSRSLDTLYFDDLDKLFSGLALLDRLDLESYPYDPKIDPLTPEQWDEVRIKDASYRARCADFLRACNAGGTLEGMQLIVRGILGVECEVYEVWRFVDNFGITSTLGRTGVTLRNEFVVTPHLKNGASSLTVKDKRTLVRLLSLIKPVDTVLTVNANGLAKHRVLNLRAVSADSSYFEVRKTVTGSLDLDKLPPPELLPSDYSKSSYWLRPQVAVKEPKIAFQSSQEHSLFYTYSPNSKGTIDSVEYFVEEPDGTRRAEVDYIKSTPTSTWGPWKTYALADSPDNYPGGKFGVTPSSIPALKTTGVAYVFQHPSQQDYVNGVKAEILAKGGEADDFRYRLPSSSNSTSSKTVRYLASDSIPTTAPSRESQVITPPFGTPRPVVDRGQTIPYIPQIVRPV